MRKIAKSPIPAILAANQAQWIAEFIADPTNATKRFRYRHPAIKAGLVAETSNKCIYCESKIGHNSPGDVEHKIPSSVDPTKHFEWSNLTIACTECNRRKNDYFSATTPFLDPYCHEVEQRVVHHGPIVSWMPGDVVSEISVKTLRLNDTSRQQLISQKVEAIDRLNNVVARLAEADPLLKELMALQLQRLKCNDAEYSGMINSICSAYGL
jgi:hypothetical protein